MLNLSSRLTTGKIKILHELRLGPPVHETVVEPVDVFGSVVSEAYELPASVLINRQ